MASYQEEITEVLQRIAKREGKKVEISFGNLEEAARCLVEDDAEQRRLHRRSPLRILWERSNTLIKIAKARRGK